MHAIYISEYDRDNVPLFVGSGVLFLCICHISANIAPISSTSLAGNEDVLDCSNLSSGGLYHFVITCLHITLLKNLFLCNCICSMLYAHNFYNYPESYKGCLWLASSFESFVPAFSSLSPFTF